MACYFVCIALNGANELSRRIVFMVLMHHIKKKCFLFSRRDGYLCLWGGNGMNIWKWMVHYPFFRFIQNQFAYETAHHMRGEGSWIVTVLQIQSNLINIFHIHAMEI